MGKRGRQALLVPCVDWKCRIPVDLVVRVDMLLLDPVRQRPIYGSRSELVTRLLRAWLATQQGTIPIDKLESTPDTTHTTTEGVTTT